MCSRRLEVIFVVAIALGSRCHGASWEDAKITLNLAGQTCAIVSNSAELLKHEYGTQIDASDVVARLNLPPLTPAHSNHTGNRTDIVFTGYPLLVGLPGKPKWAQAQGYNPENTYMGMNDTFAFLVDAYCAQDSAKPKHLISKWSSQKICMKQSKAAVRVCSALKLRCGLGPTDLLDAAWLNATRNHLPGAISTGFVGYHMLVSSCRCVRAFGFDTNTGGHYWNQKHRADKSHNFEPEHRMIKTTC